MISKSGETAETASQFLIVRDLLRRRLGEMQHARKRIVAPRHRPQRRHLLRDIADRERYATLPVPEGVGGRFSVLSAVGLFSAAMCGIDIGALWRGRRHGRARPPTSRDREPRCACSPRSTTCATAAASRIVVMMPYSNALLRPGRLVPPAVGREPGQEDLNGHGRTPVNIGPTPIKALGTDEHSQIQLYRDGPNDKLIVLLEVEKPRRDVHIPPQFEEVPALQYLGDHTLGSVIDAEKQATEFALIQSQRPCATIKFPEVTRTPSGSS